MDCYEKTAALILCDMKLRIICTCQRGQRRSGYILDFASFPVSSTMSAGLYEVSRILGHRWARGHRGKALLELLTQYTGYEDVLPTWQPIKDFMDNGVVTNSAAYDYLHTKHEL